MTELVDVAPGVAVATADIWATTSTIVAGDDGTCLVVDPGVTVADLAGLADALEARGWRVTAGFSTHPHWDHVLWSVRLGAAPRWATPRACAVADETREVIQRDTDADAPGHDHALTGRLTALPDAVANLPWSGPRGLTLPYRAHCPGSAALLLPELGVLCAGDLLSDREVPLLDLDSPDPVGDHVAALDVLEGAIRDHGVRVLIPGHGTVVDAAGALSRAEDDRAYLRSLMRGGPVEDARLADPWVAAQHERQLLWARGGRPPAA